MTDLYLPASQFGIVGDNRTDNTAAMRKAHSTGRVIYYPAGRYRFSTLNDIKSGGIVGEGIAVEQGLAGGTALITTNDTDDDVIVYNGNVLNGGPLFRDFTVLSGSLHKTGGAALKIRPIKPLEAPAEFIYLQNVQSRDIPIGIDLFNASNYVISGFQALFYRIAGIRINNPDHTDEGDGVVQSCTFFNGTGSVFARKGVGILQRSGGGLKVIANKFNGGEDGIRLDIADTTSDLIVTGNSFENASQVAIRLRNTANIIEVPVRFMNVPITGNQFSGNIQGDIVAEEIHSFLNSSYWDALTVSGNTFFCRSASARISLSCCRYFSVTGNTFIGDGKSETAIRIAKSSRSGRLQNLYAGFRRNVDNDGADVKVD